MAPTLAHSRPGVWPLPFSDDAEVRPQCGFYYIINIMIQIKHDWAWLIIDLNHDFTSDHNLILNQLGT